jgi:cleavage and polyadenylation specificity factor subunit 1
MLLRVPRIKTLDILKRGSALRLERVNIPGTDVTLYCDTSTPQPMPFITTSFRPRSLTPSTALATPGPTPPSSWFPSGLCGCEWGTEFHALIGACTPCQRSKVTRHVKAPLGNFTLPSARFSHVHIDMVGQLPVSSGFRYCLTAIDRYTCWSEALPLSDVTTEAFAKAFVSLSVPRFGCPQQFTTDQGRQFEAPLFKTLATIS